MSESTVLTIGTALSRAKQAERQVQVLVKGVWQHGDVVAWDGHGVVLTQGEDLIVFRYDSVDGVKILKDSPQYPELEQPYTTPGTIRTY